MAGDRIFLALAAYRDRHGGYPESLSELRERLGWEIPEDPFSGEDFIYRREENGFVLYSIGANLTDDQATPWDSEGPAPAEYRYTDPISGLKTADIVWRIER